MKVVILCGGKGTRIGEETSLKPKPLVEIGERPILHHIMKLYSHYGYNDFILCTGYKSTCIKEYFAHYYLHESDITFDFTKEGRERIHTSNAEPWKITIVDTGLETLTGGRLKRIQQYIGNEPFMLSYGDGVADVDIERLVATHKARNKMVTITAAQPAGRFGFLDMDGKGNVKSFREKNKIDQGWVNAGFMVIEPEFFDYITDDDMLEQQPMNTAITKNQVSAYKHDGFFAPMDTIRDKNYLEELWSTGQAPWKVWK